MTLAFQLAKVAALEAQIERLTKERDDALTCFEVTRNSCENRGAKIEQLRTLLRSAADILDEVGYPPGGKAKGYPEIIARIRKEGGVT